MRAVCVLLRVLFCAHRLLERNSEQTSLRRGMNHVCGFRISHSRRRRRARRNLRIAGDPVWFGGCDTTERRIGTAASSASNARRVAWYPRARGAIFSSATCLFSQTSAPRLAKNARLRRIFTSAAWQQHRAAPRYSGVFAACASRALCVHVFFRAPALQRNARHHQHRGGARSLWIWRMLAVTVGAFSMRDAGLSRRRGHLRHIGVCGLFARRMARHFRARLFALQRKISEKNITLAKKKKKNGEHETSAAGVIERRAKRHLGRMVPSAGSQKRQ